MRGSVFELVLFLDMVLNNTYTMDEPNVVDYIEDKMLHLVLYYLR